MLDEVNIRLINHYWLTGSFVQGTGEGHAEAPDLDVHLIQHDIPLLSEIALAFYTNLPGDPR